jgi:hypothetical protein
MELGMKRFDGGKLNTFSQIQNLTTKVITPNPYDRLNMHMEGKNPAMTPSTMKLYSFGEQGPLNFQ